MVEQEKEVVPQVNIDDLTDEQLEKLLVKLEARVGVQQVDLGMPAPDTYVRPFSRRKCMAIGASQKQPGGKTTCCRPKGHKGRHRNCRGHEW